MRDIQDRVPLRGVLVKAHGFAGRVNNSDARSARLGQKRNDFRDESVFALFGARAPVPVPHIADDDGSLGPLQMKFCGTDPLRRRVRSGPRRINQQNNKNEKKRKRTKKV